MKSINKLVFAFISTFGLMTAAHAFPHGPGFEGRFARHGERLIQLITTKLDLTEEQTGKLQAVREQMQSMIPDKEERAVRHQEFVDLMKTPTLNQQAAVDLLLQQYNSRLEQLPKVIAKLAEFTDSLTAEQKQQLAEFMQHRFNKRAAHYQ